MDGISVWIEYIIIVLGMLYVFVRIAIRDMIYERSAEMLSNTCTPRRKDILWLLKARFANEIYGVCVALFILCYLFTTKLGVYLAIIPIAMLIIAVRDAYTTYKYMKIAKAVI